MSSDLDPKDRRILYELDKDSRQPLSKIAKKTRLSKEVVHYRINNLVRRGVIKMFYTIVDTAKLGFVSHKLYFQFQNLDSEKEKEIVDFLAGHPQVLWVATCSGKWDLMLGSWARDIMDFNDNILEPILDRYSEYVLNKEVTLTKHNIQQNRRWFLKDIGEEGRSMETVSSVVGGKIIDKKLDGLDVKILKMLKDNARMPSAEIARKVGASPMVVAYRIKKLRREKVIQSFRISIDLGKLGFEFCKAFIYFKNLNHQRLEEFISYCKQNMNILNIVTCVGPWDAELEVEVENFERFHSIMKEIRERFSGIMKNYESVLISKEPRVDFMPGYYMGK